MDRLADPPEGTRLLGPFDLFLQARDRPLIVAEPALQKDLWRTLGRPGGVLVDGEIAGTWRARKTGGSMTVSVGLWSPVAPGTRQSIGEQAERLAAFRGLTLKDAAMKG